jgi:hypothetical protein
MVNSTAHDVLLEPTGLIKNNEGKRPGDVVLLLDQFFSDPHYLARWAIAAIDVFTCTVPPMVSPPECQQYESKRNLQRSERVKFTGPAIRKDEPPGTLCGLPLIKELMDTGILLMPFCNRRLWIPWTSCTKTPIRERPCINSIRQRQHHIGNRRGMPGSQ